MFLYIDATSGGIVLQVVLSGFVGGLVMLKLFWRNTIGAIFGRKQKHGEDEAPAPVPETPQSSGPAAP